MPHSSAEVARAIRDYFVAVVKGRIVGVVAVSFVGLKHAEMHSLLVDKKLKGRGIGSRLVQLAFYEAELADAKKIIAAGRHKDFLKKFGFREAASGQLAEFGGSYKKGSWLVAEVPDAEKLPGLTQFY